MVFPTPVKQSYSYIVPEGMTVCVGMRVSAPFGSRTLVGYVVGAGTNDNKKDFHEYTLKPIGKAIDEVPVFDVGLLELARWIADMYFCSLGEALDTMVPGAKKERDFIAIAEEDARLSSHALTLSDEQGAAVDGILASSEGMSYVYGITGSGKTEVYLQAALNVLSIGKQVIYLVPEISLSQQIVGTIEKRFSGLAAVLHSRLTPAQRLSEWKRIQRGEASLIVGARSAVFAPVRDLGMIIVDEEHESSYKSSNSPRYHARQVAMRRCIDAGARLVMGSATPSLEAWHGMREGKIKRFDLTQRLAGGGRPKIRIVSMGQGELSLSPDLIQEIRHTKSLGKQSILFLNRRGFSYFFYCRSCHYEMTCKRCSVGMTYHKTRGILICHYCGATAKPVSVCPDCGSLDVGYAGFGTEKVEEDVSMLFPDLTVARVDTDTISKKGSLEKIIADFRKGDIDLMLGTQMVAKGLNFPGVRLVGIINADTGLHMPDFRAAERTFGLITQVAGRAGRYCDDGEVIIQTFKPEAMPIQRASESDIEGFYQWELSQRNAQAFPPFSRLIRLVFRSRNADKAGHAASEFKTTFGRRLRSAAELLGPVECPLAKVNDSSRFHILLSTRNFQACHRELSKVLEHYRVPSGVYLEIDPDPVSIL